jgi:hypothetical protein
MSHRFNAPPTGVLSHFRRPGGWPGGLSDWTRRPEAVAPQAATYATQGDAIGINDGLLGGRLTIFCALVMPLFRRESEFALDEVFCMRYSPKIVAFKVCGGDYG